MTSWQQQIEHIGANHDAGSWTLARLAADALTLAAGENPTQLRSALRQVVRAQPSMAALATLANSVAWAVEAGRDPAQEAQRCIARGDEGIQQIAQHAAEALGRGRRAVTLSASAAVETALLSWSGPVLVLESRPRLEGRHMAARLAAHGLPTALAVDAAAWTLLRDGDTIVLGADAVAMSSFSNKIGSAALAAAAGERGLACFVLAGREKWWPWPLSDRGTAVRDPGEVWSAPPAGIELLNPYFEPIPLDRVTAVLSAEGAQRPAQVRAWLEGFAIHPWLRHLEAPG